MTRSASKAVALRRFHKEAEGDARARIAENIAVIEWCRNLCTHASRPISCAGAAVVEQPRDGAEAERSMTLLQSRIAVLAMCCTPSG